MLDKVLPLYPTAAGVEVQKTTGHSSDLWLHSLETSEKRLAPSMMPPAEISTPSIVNLPSGGQNKPHDFDFQVALTGEVSRALINTLYKLSPQTLKFIYWKIIRSSPSLVVRSPLRLFV
jgi:hypothetical protein